MIGRTLDHYQITSLLGAGGMGEVYRATDTKLGREVALKVLPADVAADAERLSRFRREAQTLAALDHPGIVTVYSVEETDGVHFLTMQMVEGRTLTEKLAGGKLPVAEICRIGSEIADALAAAHGKGIVHRDLKTANIMVGLDGRVKVLDFGLARRDPISGIEAGDATVDMMTREGVVLGTLPYMSPEQVRSEVLDGRSDIFSLGSVLYEMAGGRRPFSGSSALELGAAITRDTPAPLATVRDDLPAGLVRVIDRCLAKAPADRYQEIIEIAQALRSDQGSVGTEGPFSSGRGPLRRPLVAVLAVVLAAAVTGGALLLRGGADEGGSPIRSLAVLPLDNYSGDPTQDYFAEGMTDELTAYLARISSLRVTSRGSAMQFQGSGRPATPEIARLLDVDAVVEGSVLRDGDRVRITAQLIDARADRSLWGESFERQSHDILALQDELAAAIARAIHVQLTPDEASRLQDSSPVDPEAYDAYLKGRYFFNRPSDENLQKAIARFEDALAISPDFVPALSGLSDAVLWAGYNEGFLTATEARPRAREAARKAIALDGRSAEAYTSLATFKAWYDYDYAGSEADYRKALELNPSYAYAHDQFAMALAFLGRFSESKTESRLAIQLDPLNPQVLIDASVGLTFSAEYEAAESLVRQAEELDPTYFFPHWSYGWIAIQEDRISDSIPHFERAKTMGASAFVSAWLAYAYGAVGDERGVLRELEDLKAMSLRGQITAFNQALVSLGRGQHSQALAYLEQAHASDSQWLGWLGHDRVFDPLRREPRYAALLTKINLPREPR